MGLVSEQRWQLTPFLFTSTKSGYDASQAEGFEFGNHLSDWLKVHPYNDAWETVPRYDVRRSGMVRGYELYGCSVRVEPKIYPP